MKKIVYRYTCDCCGSETEDPVRIVAGTVNTETDFICGERREADLCRACFREAVVLKHVPPIPEETKGTAFLSAASGRESKDEKEDGRQQKTDEQKRPGDLDVPRGKGDGGDSKSGESAASGSVKSHPGGTPGRRKV